MKYLEKFEKTTQLIIFNMYVCDRKSPNWIECVKIIKNIHLPLATKSSGGHHRGLAIQALLNTDSIEDVKILSENIINKFPEKPLIVISKCNVVLKSIPIGEYQDNSIVEPSMKVPPAIITLSS